MDAGPTPNASGASSDSAAADASVGAGWQDAATQDATPPLPRQRTIAEENALPGSRTFELNQVALHHEVEGYASLASAAPGDRVQLRINVQQAQAVRWELYRYGYYQGFRARKVATSEPERVEPQPACPVSPRTGLIECSWASAFEVTIEPDWVTGQYFFKLIAADGHDSYIPLVIREAVPRAAAVYQASVATWQAYNLWGGTNLYHNYLPKEAGFSGDRAYTVSFNRPYSCGDDAPSCNTGSGHFDLAERDMVTWLEQKGVDVAYLTNLDVDREPALLLGRRLFMSVGHDEYWSLPERDALEAARSAGVSLAFFAGNTGYWRIRITAADSGEPQRHIECYKDAARDPVKGATSTAMFRDMPEPRPENALLGVMYDVHASRTKFDAFAQIVREPKHWLYEGTQVERGDVLSHVVGYEFDRVFPANSPAGLETVAHASLFNITGIPMNSDVTVYSPTPGSFVFAAGSIQWAWGLGRQGYEDPRLQRITDNLLLRAGLHVAPTQVPAPRRAGRDPRITTLAGSFEPGDADGDATSSRFGAPAGIAVAPSGQIYVTDAERHSVRVLGNDGTVKTLAGCGGSGNRDGDGSDACFKNPTGIAVGSDGTIYVSDTGNNAIRSITPAGHVSTYAGGSKAGLRDADAPLDARFTSPRGLAMGPDGALYVADGGNQQLRRIDRNGATASIVGLPVPTGVTVGSDGTVYLIDSLTGTIRRFRNGELSIIAGQEGSFGDSDGPAPAARLRAAEGIVLDGSRLIFSDAANHKLRALDLNSMQVSTVAGADGTSQDLELPRGLALGPRGLLIADSGHHRVALLTSP